MKTQQLKHACHVACLYNASTAKSNNLIHAPNAITKLKIVVRLQLKENACANKDIPRIKITCVLSVMSKAVKIAQNKASVMFVSSQETLILSLSTISAHARKITFQMTIINIVSHADKKCPAA